MRPPTMNPIACSKERARNMGMYAQTDASALHLLMTTCCVNDHAMILGWPAIRRPLADRGSLERTSTRPACPASHKVESSSNGLDVSALFLFIVFVRQAQQRRTCETKRLSAVDPDGGKPQRWRPRPRHHKRDGGPKRDPRPDGITARKPTYATSLAILRRAARHAQCPLLQQCIAPQYGRDAMYLTSDLQTLAKERADRCLRVRERVP